MFANDIAILWLSLRQANNDSLSKANEPSGLSYNISNIKKYLDTLYTVENEGLGSCQWTYNGMVTSVSEIKPTLQCYTDLRVF